MPLAEGCQKYVGRDLFVLPYYGHGWTDLRTGHSELIDDIGPEPFHMKVKTLVAYEGRFVGATGTIKQPDHPLNRLWCVCLLRTIDEIDFSQKPGDYLIWIAELEPSIAPEASKALYEWVSPNQSGVCLCG